MSRIVRSITALTFAAALAPISAPAAGEPAERVAVGQTAPDFTLPGLDGEERTLSALRGDQRAVLVFFRGAW